LIWLLKDFDLLAVLLHAATLAFESLLLGGVVFLLLIALPAGVSDGALSGCRRGIQWAAAGLALAEVASIGVASTLLVGNSDLPWGHVITAGPMIAEACAAGCALLLAGLAGGLQRERARVLAVPMLAASVGVLSSTVWLSHSVSRLNDRAFLAMLTAAHHLGSAAWIGAMPFLLLTLGRAESVQEARVVVHRFSKMALVSAALLIAAGTGMAWFYIGSPSGLYGTAYGVMLLVKIYLLLLMLLLGAGNWYVQRKLDTDPQPLLVRLRRFAEAEVGLGFTVILAAASLTSQPPATDLVLDRLSTHEIAARFRVEKPRMTSPPFAALAPVDSIEKQVHQSQYSAGYISDANDIAWSEYNHHWAGLLVLVAGTLALLSRFQRFRWARFWPISFAGLSVFIVLRADSENWPLGPRSFWKSFYSPDVLQHRLYALLILGFAVFECAVQANWIQSKWAKLAFPLMCAVGAALLLTHNHALGNIKEELLAEMSHSSLALLGATAGWARWLELRLPRQDGERRVAGYVWPVALMMAGLVLLDYREA
jgi:copper resistance protein D